jgi:hypothetical protein
LLISLGLLLRHSRKSGLNYLLHVDEQDYASEAEELADLLADNRLSELAELDEDGLRRVLRTIGDADPSFDIELTGFMEDEIRKLMDDEENPEQELETIPRMECQAFEHHDYLVFMFHDLRDWMQALQLMGVREVDYSITRRTKKIGLGRVLHGKRLLDLCHRAAMAGTPPSVSPARDPQPEPGLDDQQPPPVSRGHAPRAGKRG